MKANSEPKNGHISGYKKFRKMRILTNGNQYVTKGSPNQKQRISGALRSRGGCAKSAHALRIYIYISTYVKVRI